MLMSRTFSNLVTTSFCKWHFSGVCLMQKYAIIILTDLGVSLDVVLPKTMMLHPGAVRSYLAAGWGEEG